MDYKKMTNDIIDAIGGMQNISKVGHCATRLRINYQDDEKIDVSKFQQIEGVFGVVEKKNQIQLIFGGNVAQVYNHFITHSKFDENIVENKGNIDEEIEEKNFKYYVDIIGGFFAEIFMPVVPALITGGIILAFNNLLINYFGVNPSSGTATIILAIFSSAFSMLPIYLGYTTARKFNLSPILGAFLGAILVNPTISGASNLDFLGIPVTQVEYGGSIMPVVMGVAFMYYVDKFFDEIIPEFGKYLLKPFLTMLVVVPITLIIFGPIGTLLSGYVGTFVMWLMNTLGFIALPILSLFYPYMVMLGIDKALMPIGFQAVETIGYDPFNMVVGFISNLAVGASALAVSRHVKKNKEQSGAYFSFGMTGLFGITEPAFYGALIGRPKALLGTAIGAVSAGLFAGIFGMKSYVMGGAPGLFTLLFFLNPDGTMSNMIIAIITGIISITVSFIATSLLLRGEKKKRDLQL